MTLPWVKRRANAYAPNKPTLQKQRCIDIMGRKVACVKDKANLEITPGWIAIAAVVVVLVFKR